MSFILWSWATQGGRLAGHAELGGSLRDGLMQYFWQADELVCGEVT
jgi:hypothetical protein